MAAALQCEICGGKLIGKPGGIFECDSCGMEYNTEWAKAKIQEIRGTVQVEGTVEVTGKVQVDSSAEMNALLQRGKMALEDEDWAKAKGLFNQIQNAYPENAEAYLGLAMAENQCRDRKILEDRYLLAYVSFSSNRSIQRARQFSPELDKWFAALDARAEKRCAELRKARLRIAPASVCLCTGLWHTVALRSDGTVLATGNNSYSNDGACDVSSWKNIIAVAAGADHTVGLRSDGTVVATGNNSNGKCNTWNWSDIKAIAASEGHTVGLKKDGRVVAIGLNDWKQCEVSAWRDVVAIAAGRNTTYGLKADGSVLVAGFAGKSASPDKNVVAVYPALADFRKLYRDGTFGVYWEDQMNLISEKIRADGTVTVAGLSGWRDIVAIASGHKYTIGLKSDGTLVSSGDNKWGQCNVRGWKLFGSIDTLEAERRAMADRAEAERRAAEVERKAKIASLKEEKASLEAELPTLKGIFSGGKRKQITDRLYQIIHELDKLDYVEEDELE